MTRTALIFCGACGLAACGVGDASMVGNSGNRVQPPAVALTNDGDSWGVNPFNEGAVADAGQAVVDAGELPSPPPPADPCPPGQAPTYRYVADQQSNPSGQRISAGPGGASMTQTCEPSSCGAGEVAVAGSAGELQGAAGSTAPEAAAAVCVPPPLACPRGQFANYVLPTTTYAIAGSAGIGVTSGEWKCVGPCDVLIQYGGLFGMRLVCAPPPPPSSTCSSGTEPIFEVETEEWKCQPACNGGTYDPTQYQGVSVCVPC